MRVITGLAKMAALLALISPLLSAPMEAQGRRQVTASPDELVATFVHDFGGDGPPPASAGSDLAAVLLSRADYPVASLNAVMDGLEGIALSQRPADLRSRAILYLALSGSRDALHPRRGTAARLKRIYQRLSDGQVRAAVVSGLARSAEHQDALVFLEDVAAKEPQEFPGSSQAALTAIASHADEGTGTLRRLHQAKAIHDRDALLWLDRVAKTGYRVR